MGFGKVAQRALIAPWVVLGTVLSACAALVDLSKFDGARAGSESDASASGPGPAVIQTGEAGAGTDAAEPDGAVAAEETLDAAEGREASNDAAVRSGDSGALGGPPWLFDTSLDGFFKEFSDPPSLLAATTLEWTNTDGNPTKGAVMMTIPFTGPNQKFETSVTLLTGIDITGKTVSASVRLVSGLSGPTNLGRAKLYVKSTPSQYYYADDVTAALNATAGWVPLTLSGSHPAGIVTAGYDPTQIIELGIEVDSPIALGTITTAVVLIDTIEIK